MPHYVRLNSKTKRQREALVNVCKRCSLLVMRTILFFRFPSIYWPIIELMINDKINSAQMCTNFGAVFEGMVHLSADLLQLF